MKSMFRMVALTMLLLLCAVKGVGQTAYPSQDATVVILENGGDIRDPHLHVTYKPNGHHAESVIKFDLSVLPSRGHFFTDSGC